MQKLKTYISALIEAAFGKKKAFISNQAMPGDTDINISVNPSTTNPTPFVAPSDGYLYVSDRGVSGSESSLEVNHTDHGPFGARSFGSGTGIIRLIFPCKKGRAVSISFAQTSLANVVCRFRSTIGGGLNSILESGGELCLRLKIIFNHFSSSLARKRTQTEARFKSTGHLVATPLRVMALFCSAHHQSKDEAHLSMLGERFPFQATVLQSALHVLQSRVQKVKLFSGHTAERLTFRLLPRQKARLNLVCEGGAL